MKLPNGAVPPLSGSYRRVANVSTHTPRVEIINSENYPHLASLRVDGTSMYPQLIERASAEYVARAVNAHDAMLTALRTVAELYEYEQERGVFPPGRTYDTIPHHIGQSARAAIAIAEASE